MQTPLCDEIYRENEANIKCVGTVRCTLLNFRRLKSLSELSYIHSVIQSFTSTNNEETCLHNFLLILKRSLQN